jgi:2,3-dihydroxyphenylpropionate 1,2-dioxygenase
MSKDNTNGVRMGIVGAAIVPHAPQLLTMPDTEDLDQVVRVKVKMQQIGDDRPGIGT